MIANFGNTYLFILFLVGCVITPAFYSYKLWEAKSIFKKYNIGCMNWGLVAGKSQTHFNWKTTKKLDSKKKNKNFLKKNNKIPEPKIWFHDIFRMDGSPYNKNEINFIKKIIKSH